MALNESLEVRSLQFQVESVLEARRLKTEVLGKFGGRSEQYKDARDLVRHTEGKLLDSVIRMFEPVDAER